MSTGSILRHVESDVLPFSRCTVAISFGGATNMLFSALWYFLWQLQVNADLLLSSLTMLNLVHLPRIRLRNYLVQCRCSSGICTYPRTRAHIRHENLFLHLYHHKWHLDVLDWWSKNTIVTRVADKFRSRQLAEYGGSLVNYVPRRRNRSSENITLLSLSCEKSRWFHMMNSLTS